MSFATSKSEHMIGLNLNHTVDENSHAIYMVFWWWVECGGWEAQVLVLGAVSCALEPWETCVQRARWHGR